MAFNRNNGGLGRRAPLAVSTKQNKTESQLTTAINKSVYFVSCCHFLETNHLLPQTMTQFKTSKVPVVVNDENAGVAEVSASFKQNGLKSRIPIDAQKKSQTMATKKVKPKTETKGTELEVKEQLGYSSNMIPTNVENIDANDGHNVFLTPDYVNDIYAYLRHLEVSLLMILI